MTLNGTYSCPLVESFDDENKLGLTNLLDNLFIYHIQSRLVDQPDIDTLLSASQNSIPRTVQHFTEGHDISSSTLGDDLVFPRNEFIVILKEPLSVFLDNPRNLGTSRENEAKTALKEDAFDDGNHLRGIGREI